MLRTLSLFIGVVINLVVISTPVFFINIELQKFFSSPVTWLFYIGMTSFCFLEANASFDISSRQTVRSEKHFVPYLAGLSVLLVLWVSLLEYATKVDVNPYQVITGLLLIIVGIFTRVVSIKTLNKYFVSHIGYIHHHALVTSGIYSIIRHPSETGLVLICLGVAIMLGSVSGLLVLMITVLPLTFYRVKLEDRLLRSLFKVDFENYANTTPGLFPKMHRTS